MWTIELAVVLTLLVALSIFVLYKIYARKKPRTKDADMAIGVGSTEEVGQEEVANGQSMLGGKAWELAAEQGKAEEASGSLKGGIRDQAKQPQREVEKATSSGIEQNQDGKELQKKPVTTDEAERESPLAGPDSEEDRGITNEEQQRIEERHGGSVQEARHGAKDAGEKRQGERKRLDPEKRGGRPHDRAQGRGQQKLREPKSRRMKPEIVCLNKQRHWILALEIPDELLNNSTLSVFQNGAPLIPDATEESLWHLNAAVGEVDVRWNGFEGDENVHIALGEEGYLFFKLSGQIRGRRVKSPSRGSYLVVVPASVKRDETLCGPPPVVPEPTSITGYLGHYFDLDGGTGNRVAFHTPTSTPVLFTPNMPRFELIGTRLNDANENIGPLFGDKAPQIRALDGQAWKDVETIVLGEEGSRKGNWRLSFGPVSELLEQEMPAELEARKSGWYFVRLYDGNDDLLESFDFRFVSKLKGIKVRQPSALPLEVGHTAVSIELLHDPDCLVQPSVNLADDVLIERHNGKTILTIPPSPTKDKTRWLVGSQNSSQVELIILVERIWWGLGEESERLSEWSDTLLTLSREDFVATSDAAIWMRLPKPRWVDTIWIGFEQMKSRPCQVRVTENAVSIPLRDFADSQEVGDHLHEHNLIVWIKRDGRLVGRVIALIPAELQEPTAEVRSPLNLSVLSAPRLASVLTELRRQTEGPVSSLIREVRQQHPGGRRSPPARSTEYINGALCLIAFLSELAEGDQAKVLSVKDHWTVKARRARQDFPRVMTQLRNRYEELKVGHAQGSLRRRDGR